MPTSGTIYFDTGILSGKRLSAFAIPNPTGKGTTYQLPEFIVPEGVSLIVGPKKGMAGGIHRVKGKDRASLGEALHVQLQPGAALTVENVDLRFGVYVDVAENSTVTFEYNKATTIGRGHGTAIVDKNNVALTNTDPYMNEYGNMLKLIGGDTPTHITANILHNTAINRSGKSDVEDVINLYSVSGGGDTTMIQVVDNKIIGAHGTDPEYGNKTYSGGGIMLDTRASFVNVYNNLVTNSSNYGISVDAGTGNLVWGNTITNATHSAIQFGNYYKEGTFSGNQVLGNTIVGPKAQMYVYGAKPSHLPGSESAFSVGANNMIANNFWVDTRGNVRADWTPLNDINDRSNWFLLPGHF